MLNTLAWLSNYFIVISTGSIKLLESVSKNVFSLISRDFTALLKKLFKVSDLHDDSIKCIRADFTKSQSASLTSKTSLIEKNIDSSTFRAVKQTQAKCSGSWLNVKPLKEQGFARSPKGNSEMHWLSVTTNHFAACHLNALVAKHFALTIL